jgi:hypothetical protein
VVGKVRLALSPMQNHWWRTTLALTARGLTTSAMPWSAELVQIDFDFLEHRLVVATSTGRTWTLALRPMSVADFYRQVMDGLHGLGVDVSIWPVPVEVANPIPFAEDTIHSAYDPAAAHRFWRILLQADRVFKVFEGRFLGKSSPVQFFWGSFDLAISRFSGRRAPMFTGPALNVNPHVMHEAYSHEVISAGFRPGTPGGPVEEPAFYSYAVPEPAGFREATVLPGAARYRTELGEFILPYEAVRTSERGEEELLAFLQSTYEVAATLGEWDRALLEERPACACDAG